MIKENILKRNLKKQSKKIVFLTIFIAICIFSIYQIQKNSSQLLSSSSKFLSKLDLNIQKIKIEGTNNSKGVDIIRALDLNNDTLLINFNLQEASKRISQLRWIKDTKIKKLYPSTLEININEYEPIAIWFYDGNKYLVDQDGQIIKGLDPSEFKNLKFVAGYNALEYIPNIINSLDKHPTLESRVKSILRVGDRRWTIRLFNGMTIYLPEEGLSKAIQKLEKLDKDSQLLSRYIDVIDMRLPNRIDVMPSLSIKTDSI